MAIAVTVESPARPDNPMLTLLQGAAIGAGATAFSDVLDVANARGVAIFSTVDQPHLRQVQASHDGATWCAVNGGGSLPSAMTYTGAAAGAVCQVLTPCGIRFLRVAVTNNGASGATASVWATVQQ